MNRGALPILAILLLAPLAALPGANAAPPRPAEWSGYDLLAPVSQVALARESDVIAAALGPYQVRTGPLPTSDLVIFRFGSGFVRNDTLTTPPGRTHAALSASGHVMASLAVDATVQSPGGELKLIYMRRASSGSWADDYSRAAAVIPGRPADLLVSEDGMRVVTASNTDTHYSVRAYSWSSDRLTLMFELRGEGSVRDVAGTANLTQIVTALRVPEAGKQIGVMEIVPFEAGSPVHRFYDRRGDESPLWTVAFSRDGSRIAAGAENGTVFMFHNRGAATQPPVSLRAGSLAVKQLAMSGDGTRLAAAAGRNLYHFELTAQDPIQLWTTVTTAEVASLAYTETGRLLAVGTVGSGASFLGFGDGSSVALWNLPGQASTVTVNANGTYAVFAGETKISAVEIRRGFNLTALDGSKQLPTRSLRPFGTTTYELLVRNVGSAPETVTFEGPKDLDVTIATTPSGPTIAPGSESRVALRVTPGRLFPGDYSFNVTALTVSGLRDEVSVNLTITPTVNVSLLYDGPTDLVAAAGEESIILLGVRNDGSQDSAVGVRVNQDVGQGGIWRVRADPASFTLAPHTVTTVRVSIVPPADAEDGAANRLTFVLEGQNVSDTRQVTFRVNPSVGVRLDATGRVKFVEPGRTGNFEVTVLNNGSLPRMYEMSYDISSTGGRHWVADVPLEPFRLEPGATRVVQVRVFAPDGATTSDRATVLVIATSIPELAGELPFTANVTLFANAAPPPTPTTPGDGGGLEIPTPALGVALAVLAAVALRRRKTP